MALIVFAFSFSISSLLDIFLSLLKFLSKFIKDFISASYNWSYNNGYTTDVNYQDGWNWKSISVVKKMGHIGRNWLDEIGTVN